MLDPIDNKLRRSVEQVNIDWDKEEMWSAIEAELPSNKRGLIWLWFGIGLLFIIGSISIYMYYNAEKEETLTPHQALADIDPSHQAISDITISTPADIQKLTPAKVLIKETITQYDQSLHLDNRILGDDNTLQNPSESTNSDIQNTWLNKRKNTKSFGQQLESSMAKVDKRSTTQYTSLPLNRSFSLLNHDRPIYPLAVDITNKSIKVSKAKKDWSFELAFAALASNSSYESLNFEYLPSSNTYQNLESLELGFHLTRSLNQRFSLTSGLDIGRDILKFEYTSILQAQEEQEVPDAFVFEDENNEIQYLAGKELVTRTTTQSTLTFNQHWYASLPILLNWNQTLGKSRFIISAGPSLRYDFSQKGRFVDSNGSIDDVNSDFYSSVFMNTQVSYIRPFNDKIALTAGLVYRRSMTEQKLYHQSAYTQSFLGLQAGFSIKM